MEVKGRDQATGLPKTVLITSEEVRQALMEPVQLILDVIKNRLEETPAELAADSWNAWAAAMDFVGGWPAPCNESSMGTTQMSAGYHALTSASLGVRKRMS